MEYGISLPQWSPSGGPEGWRAIAAAAERLDFDALWRGDHVVFPEELPEGGVLGATATTDAYDAFATLAYLAAETEEISLGTNIAVAPYRHPVMLAKLALTLDNLTNGRFEFGIGAGWLQSEFETLEVPYEERSSRTSEFLSLFERVVDNGVTGFRGPFTDFEGAGFYPRPVHDEGPPLWIGGTSSSAVERVARFGHGWTVIGLSPADARSEYDRLQQAWDEHGRQGRPAFAVTTGFELTDGRRDDKALIGPPEHVVGRIRAFAEAGVTRLILRQRGRPLDAQIESLEQFNVEIIPSI